MRYQLLAEVQALPPASAAVSASKRVVAAIDALRPLGADEAGQIAQRLIQSLRTAFARRGLELSAPELVQAPLGRNPPV